MNEGSGAPRAMFMRSLREEVAAWAQQLPQYSGRTVILCRENDVPWLGNNYCCIRFRVIFELRGGRHNRG